MTDLPVDRPIARMPTHPGELMREILNEHLRLPIAEAARRMKISRPTLEATLNGSGAVTADMRLRSGRLTGGPAEPSLQTPAQQDIWTARQRQKDTPAQIEPAA